MDEENMRQSWKIGFPKNELYGCWEEILVWASIGITFFLLSPFLFSERFFRFYVTDSLEL